MINDVGDPAASFSPSTPYVIHPKGYSSPPPLLSLPPLLCPCFSSGTGDVICRRWMQARPGLRLRLRSRSSWARHPSSPQASSRTCSSCWTFSRHTATRTSGMPRLVMSLDHPVSSGDLLDPTLLTK